MIEAHANLGWLFEKQGQITQAEASFRRATALEPVHVQAHSLYGTFLAGLRRFVEAEVIYRQALSANPMLSPTWSNLGVLFLQTGQLDQAQMCFRTALAIDPDGVEANVNQAYLCLRNGEFEEGWRLYERRGWKNQLQSRIHSPRWSGERLEGKAILIVHEGGYGDMINFCRYAPLLKQLHGATVSVLIPAPLKSLFTSLEGVDVLLVPSEPLEALVWDCWTSMMSLPYHFATNQDTIPASIPYLKAPALRPPSRKAEPPATRELGMTLRVGLVWRGSPSFMNDAERSEPARDSRRLVGLSQAGITACSARCR